MTGVQTCALPIFDRPPFSCHTIGVPQKQTATTMAMYSNTNTTYHRAGHKLGDLNKKTSIGDGKRKKGSFKRKGKKPYRGQGRG